MGNVWRDEDEIAGPGLGDKLELFAPAHARPAPDHVDNALQRTVVVSAGLGVGIDMHRPGPYLLRADASMIDRRGALHAGRLRGVGVELVAGDHLDPVDLPVNGARRPAVVIVHGSFRSS